MSEIKDYDEMLLLLDQLTNLVEQMALAHNIHDEPSFNKFHIEAGKLGFDITNFLQDARNLTTHAAVTTVADSDSVSMNSTDDSVPPLPEWDCECGEKYPITFVKCYYCGAERPALTTKSDDFDPSANPSRS